MDIAFQERPPSLVGETGYEETAFAGEVQSGTVVGLLAERDAIAQSILMQWHA
jgi:hypothetical protein